MLMCNQTVTLVHHVKGNDGDSYTCKTYSNASWFEKRGISTSKDGAAPSNTYEVRIMTREDISPSAGDFVVLGAVANVAAPSDLAKHDHFRVTAIGDNRRGKLAHWRLSGQ
jgi:hypothetical protein